MNELLIARHLGKQFRIYQRPFDRALDWVTPGPARRGDTIWAVRDVDLRVEPGQVLGVIGHNGAGKTTLLRLLAGSLQASTGECRRRGRLLSLHGLNLSLHGALTGRENVRVAADTMRLSSSFYRRHVGDVLDFSGLGEFFDRPVGCYSGGMRIRLVCATFAFLDADVLLLDEALSAGDAQFGERWRQRLEQRIAEGTAVVMVSHDFGAVRALCDEVLLLARGEVQLRGPAATVVARYLDEQRAGCGGQPRPYSPA